MKPGGFHDELDSAHRRISSYTPHLGGYDAGCGVWGVGHRRNRGLQGLSIQIFSP